MSLINYLINFFISSKVKPLLSFLDKIGFFIGHLIFSFLSFHLIAFSLFFSC